MSKSIPTIALITGDKVTILILTMVLRRKSERAAKFPNFSECILNDLRDGDYIAVGELGDTSLAGSASASAFLERSTTTRKC